MGRVWFVIVCLLLSCAAQELPAPMQRAVQSLSKKQSEWRMTEPVLLAQPSSDASSKTCAVPLLEMRVDHPERFTMKVLPADSSIDKQSRIRPPAPACDSGQPNR